MEISNSPITTEIALKPTQSLILANQSIMKLTSEFTQLKAISKRGLKQEDSFPNPLDEAAQIYLIENIISRIYNIFEDGKEKFIFDLDNGETKYIERNYKNFKEVVKLHMKDILVKGDFETINLPLLFEHLKTRSAYSYHEYRSVFFDKTQFSTNEKQKSLVLEIKINYTHDLTGVSPEAYKQIVESIGRHWMGNIPHILDFVVASKFATDKKNLWFLVMADSNFGKSKLFKWMEDWDGAAFLQFEDMVSSGINDKKPEDYYNKLCLVIDEVMNFHRKLFEVEDTLTIRPMRNHAVYVPINSRILLSADGGTFNDDFLDKQITNRVACLDLRNTNSEDLGELEVTKKYGKGSIKRVMSHYLFNEIINRLSLYKSKTKHESEDMAEEVIDRFFVKHKMVKKDFFKMVEDSMLEILADPVSSVGSRVYDEIEESIIRNYIYKGESGYIITNPSYVIEKLLIRYDKSLEYELKFKKLKQMADKIGSWTQSKFNYETLNDHTNLKTKKKISGIFISKTVKETTSLEECPF